MLTREEALQTIHDCRITSLGELAHGYAVYQATTNTLINQLFDQQDQLHQQNKALVDERANMQRTHQRTIESYRKQNQTLTDMVEMQSFRIKELEAPKICGRCLHSSKDGYYQSNNEMCKDCYRSGYKDGYESKKTK